MKPGETPQIPGEIPEDLEKLITASRKTESVRGKMEFSVPQASRSGSRGNGRERGNRRNDREWVETREAEGLPPNGIFPVLAIDCEMVCSFASFKPRLS